MDIGQRIKRLRNSIKISQRELERRAKVSQSIVSQLEAGTQKNTSAQNLAALADVLGTTSYFLMTGKHDRRVVIDKAFENTSPGHRTLKRIPVLSFVQAGKLSEVFDSGENEPLDYVYTAEKVSDRTFALDVVGDSMNPTFTEGDRLIVDPSIAPRAGDYVIATNDKYEATFKRYKQIGVSSSGAEIFELVPLNEFYASYRSDEVPLRVVGVVVSYSRKVRK